MKIRRIPSNIFGFALPTVLIASVVMLAVLATSVAAVTSTRTALQAQFYNQLARDAAQSGLEMAKACIAAGTTTWANPLRPSSDCNGLAAQCTAPGCYLLRSGDIRSTFSVSTPSVAGDVGSVQISGTVEQTRSSNGTVWRSYQQTLQQKTVTTGGAPAPEAALWSQLAVGNGNTCGITTNSSLYCWGKNTLGAVGDNTTTHRSIPTATLQGTMPSGWSMRQIASGNEYSCGIASDNKSYCWGNNGNGMYGNGTTTRSDTPVATSQGAMPAGWTIRQISVGVSHTCAIASDNKAYCWGLNGNGQLGDGSTTQRTTPVAVAQGAIPVGATIKQIGVGVSHTCALASDNKTYCWGLNTNGQVGDNSTTQRTTPVAINRGAMTTTMTHVQLAIGGYGGCVIASNEKPYCWGLNSNGQVGDNTTTQRTSPVAVVQGAMPASFTVSQLIGGLTHTCAIAMDNKVYCWGANGSGQLGDNSTTQRNLPVAVSQGALPAGLMVRQLALGGYSTCAIAMNSNAYCWGQNTNGGLGDSSTTQRTTPVAVSPTLEVNYMNMQQISTNSSTSCATVASMKVYCWGSNSDGQIGDNTTTNRLVPTAALDGTMPSSGVVRQVSVGAYTSCAIAADNKAYCWGKNDVGQIGNNTTTASLTPTAVSQGAMPAGWSIRQIASASNHTCAIASNNLVYCWGNNVLNTLGDASSTQRLTPVAVAQGAVPAGSTYRQVATGFSNGCVIASNNLIYCWGYNLYGSVGDNSTTTRNAPVALAQGAVPAGSTFQQIGLGTYFGCALASNNLVYCWGRNNNGQLGDGSTTQRNTPVAVSQGAIPVGATIQQLIVGYNHACVIASNNLMYCWGSGGLGDDPTANRTAPVAVAQGTVPAGGTFRQGAAGFSHSCGIASDSKAYCWGSNTFGYLGNNTTTTSLTPTAVTPLVLSGPASSNTYYF